MQEIRYDECGNGITTVDDFGYKIKGTKRGIKIRWFVSKDIFELFVSDYFDKMVNMLWSVNFGNMHFNRDTCTITAYPGMYNDENVIEIIINKMT